MFEQQLKSISVCLTASVLTHKLCVCRYFPQRYLQYTTLITWDVVPKAVHDLQELKHNGKDVILY